MPQQKKSWFAMRGRSANAASISIFSEIGEWGVTADDFRRELEALGDVDELAVSISSAGGDVSAGFAIYDLLERHPANKVVTISGLAASMASVIAMVGDKVVMPRNALLMIHNPWGQVIGESEQIISFGEALGKMQEQIADAYVNRSGMDRKEVIRMMNRETWLNANEALKLNLVDEIAEPIKMAAAFDISRFHNVPAAFGRTMESIMKKRGAQAETENEELDEQSSVKTEDEIREEILATQDEIRAMCNIAGKPELADGFIKAKKSPQDVLADLNKQRAEGDKSKNAKNKGDDIHTRHNPNPQGDGGKALDPVAAFAKWNSAGRK